MATGKTRRGKLNVAPGKVAKPKPRETVDTESERDRIQADAYNALSDLAQLYSTQYAMHPRCTLELFACCIVQITAMQAHADALDALERLGVKVKSDETNSKGGDA